MLVRAGSRNEDGLARIYIMVGEYDPAIQLIRKLLEHCGTYDYNITRLKLHPAYDPLRDLPEFQAILEDPKYQIE